MDAVTGFVSWYTYFSIPMGVVVLELQIFI